MKNTNQLNGLFAVNRQGVHLIQNFKNIKTLINSKGELTSEGLSCGLLNLENSNGDIGSASTGYDYVIQTTTQIMPKAVKQVFYEIPVADFVPIEVGVGAGLEQLRTNLEFLISGDFAEGYTDASVGNSRIPSVDVGISNKNAKIKYWRKKFEYSFMEALKASVAINYDLVAGKQSAVKKDWDLGIQERVFLGEKSDSEVPGLLTNADVESDLTTITEAISDMDPTAYMALIKSLVNAYWKNSNYTRFPDTFVMPASDKLGLQVAVSAAYPNVTKEDWLQNALNKACGKKVTILGTPYCEPLKNAGFIGASGKYRYALYNKDPEVLRMDIPIDFTLLAPATPNNFSWEGIGYGAHTGTIVYRPREVLYFDYSA